MIMIYESLMTILSFNNVIAFEHNVVVRDATVVISHAMAEVSCK